MCRTWQKRVGYRLQNLNKKAKGLRGKGKLTDRIIDKLQNNYGIAIRSNKNNLEAMEAGTKSLLFYVDSSQESNLHCPHCPTGSDSWCKYNKDEAAGKGTCKPVPSLPIAEQTSPWPNAKPK